MWLNAEKGWNWIDFSNVYNCYCKCFFPLLLFLLEARLTGGSMCRPHLIPTQGLSLLDNSKSTFSAAQHHSTWAVSHLGKTVLHSAGAENSNGLFTSTGTPAPGSVQCLSMTQHCSPQLYCLPPTPPKDASPDPACAAVRDAGKYHLHLVDGMKMECSSPIRSNLAQTTTHIPSYSDYSLAGAHEFPGGVFHSRSLLGSSPSHMTSKCKSKTRAFSGKFKVHTNNGTYNWLIN